MTKNKNNVIVKKDVIDPSGAQNLSVSYKNYFRKLRKLVPNWQE